MFIFTLFMFLNWYQERIQYFHWWRFTEEISPPNTVYKNQCSDITALKLTYNAYNSIKSAIFLEVKMDLSFRESALCIEHKQ